MLKLSLVFPFLSLLWLFVALLLSLFLLFLVVPAFPPLNYILFGEKGPSAGIVVVVVVVVVALACVDFVSLGNFVARRKV